MILYRITSRHHAHDLSGTGSMIYGGRWNKKGTRLLYTSCSLSLAALEIIANLSSQQLNRSLYCVELYFPDQLPIKTIKKLPDNWNRYPYSGETVSIGSDFIMKNGLCLKVPSAIISTEFNYLINPAHEDFHQVKLIDARPLILDKRLVVN